MDKSIKIKNFEKLMEDAIKKASEGLTREIDVHLLTDIKRMVQLGVLTYEEESGDIEIDPMNESFGVKTKVRIRFTGEEKIKEQAKRIEELENERDELNNHLIGMNY